MSRMGEWAMEQENTDLADASWHQAEMEERRQREEQAIAHAKPFHDELKQLIEQTKR